MKLNGHLPEGFWKVTAGNIISVVLTILTVVYGLGRVNAKIDGLTEWKSSVDARIERLDEGGTRFQIGRNQFEDERSAEQDRRITSMETTLQQVVPDVREIKTKIDLVAKYLEEAKTAKK